MKSYNTLIIGTGCAGFNAADKLYDLGDKIGMKIHVMHEDIFNSMHHI